MVELERRFSGAYPYLRLIADANHIADPFDLRVVEAYWIGNPLLDNVSRRPLHESLAERFRARMPARSFEWLGAVVGMGATPHHNFHVFSVYPRAGLMNDAAADIRLETMDNCRISWGRVLTIGADTVVVARPAIELSGGKLVVGPPRQKTVTWQLDGRGLSGPLTPGDVVSIHWSWACEVLSSRALARLKLATRGALAEANQTV